MSSPNHDSAEIIMQVHPPHTMPSRLPAEQFNPDMVRQWVTLCAELGVTAIFWMVNYVGKATYHSEVTPRMMPLEEGYFEKRGIPGGGRLGKCLTGSGQL